MTRETFQALPWACWAIGCVLLKQSAQEAGCELVTIANGPLPKILVKLLFCYLLPPFGAPPPHIYDRPYAPLVREKDSCQRYICFRTRFLRTLPMNRPRIFLLRHSKMVLLMVHFVCLGPSLTCLDATVREAQLLKYMN